jgi:hypothetical protein
MRPSSGIPGRDWTLPSRDLVPGIQGSPLPQGLGPPPAGPAASSEARQKFYFRKAFYKKPTRDTETKDELLVKLSPSVSFPRDTDLSQVLAVLLL